MGFHPRTESCEEWHECATWGVIEQVKDLLGPQDGFTAGIWKYNAFMDQNSQAASLLLNNKTIRAIENLVDSGRLPDGHATIFFLKISNAVFHPMEDPDFGDPFECVESLWTGLYGFRYWRAFIQLPDHSLTLGENFVSLECYNTVEATVHGCTNWALVAFRHKSPTTPWRLAGPLRNVATTVPYEGTFAAIRVGRIGHSNSVNCTLKEFIDKLSKVVGSTSAKARMAKHGVKIRVSRDKQKAWAIKTARDEKKWADCEMKMAAFKAEGGGGTQALKEELSRCKARGKENAKALIERHTSMAGLLKDTPLWDDPTGPAPWREALGNAFLSRVISDDTPVLPGSRPLHPSKFPIDENELARAEKRSEEWAQNLLDHDVALFEEGSV